jgi:hypothetical protein
MKAKILLFTILAAVAIQCTKHKATTETDDRFTTYLASLEQIDFPFEFNTRDGLHVRSKNYDSTLFPIYKYAGSVAPYGRLPRSDNFVMTIEVVVGDIVVPVLMIYDETGVKIDSLNPIDKAGGDIGYESDEYVTIHTDKIIVIDSTKSAELSADRSDIIDGTWKLTVDTTFYEISKSGRIRKMEQ